MKQTATYPRQEPRALPCPFCGAPALIDKMDADLTYPNAPVDLRSVGVRVTLSMAGQPQIHRTWGASASYPVGDRARIVYCGSEDCSMKPSVGALSAKGAIVEWNTRGGVRAPARAGLTKSWSCKLVRKCANLEEAEPRIVSAHSWPSSKDAAAWAASAPTPYGYEWVTVEYQWTKVGGSP